MAATRRPSPATIASSSRGMTVAERPARRRATDVAAGDRDAVTAGHHIDNEAVLRRAGHAVRDGERPPDGSVFDRWLRARSEGAKKP